MVGGLENPSRIRPPPLAIFGFCSVITPLFFGFCSVCHSLHSASISPRSSLGPRARAPDSPPVWPPSMRHFPAGGSRGGGSVNGSPRRGSGRRPSPVRWCAGRCERGSVWRGSMRPAPSTRAIGQGRSTRSGWCAHPIPRGPPGAPTSSSARGPSPWWCSMAGRSSPALSRFGWRSSRASPMRPSSCWGTAPVPPMAVPRSDSASPDGAPVDAAS